MSLCNANSVPLPRLIFLYESFSTWVHFSISNIRPRSVASIWVVFLFCTSSNFVTAMDNHIDVYDGQRIGVHIIKQDPNLLPPRGPYRDANAALNLKHGVEFFSLDIEAVIKGSYAPDILDFYLSWSKEKASNIRQDSAALPVIVEYGKQARSVPTEVKGFNLVASKNAQINFSKNKVQTVTYIWLDAEKSQDYARYELGMEAIAKQLNIITQVKFDTKNSEYMSFPDQSQDTPDYVIFTEWPHSGSIKEYFDSEEYKKFSPYLESGTKDISILQFDSDSFYSSTIHGLQLTPEKL